MDSKEDCKIKEYFKYKYRDSLLKKLIEKDSGKKNDLKNIFCLSLIMMSIAILIMTYAEIMIVGLIILLASMIKYNNKNLLAISTLGFLSICLTFFCNDISLRNENFYNMINNPDNHYVLLDHNAHVIKNNADYDQCYAFDKDNNIIMLSSVNSKNIERVECLNIFRKN